MSDIIREAQADVDRVESRAEKKWYVSLGDGTFVEMDGLPYVFFAPQRYIEHLDEEHGGEAPKNCNEDGLCEHMEFMDSHIHIRELVNESHWDDHTPVTERTTPDRINS